MDNFHYVGGGKELLDLVQPLWEKLNKHHEVQSNHFADRFKNLTFDMRKNKFIQDDTSKVKIELVKDIEKDRYIGYCISTVDKELIGEIDSLYIEQEYRKYGLGDKLMKSALDWLDSNEARIKIIGVTEGNEKALAFYEKYGFYKRRIVLEQI
ncbi:GNAT family N-acetyltransferase [Anaerosolibacter sp.]|uniref:GNAT family N-acetyltransferase n=1 Tax=Anaerosolibacter sp. TaxID=1872527 RepID=UPI0039F062C3